MAKGGYIAGIGNRNCHISFISYKSYFLPFPSLETLTRNVILKLNFFEVTVCCYLLYRKKGKIEKYLKLAGIPGLGKVGYIAEISTRNCHISSNSGQTCGNTLRHRILSFFAPGLPFSCVTLIPEERGGGSTYSGEEWLRLGGVYTNESFLLQLKKNASQTKFTGVPSPDGPQGQVRTF